MQVEVQKWGNSAAIRLSKSLLELVRTQVGEKLDVEMTEDGVLLKRALVDENLTLEDLLEGTPVEATKLTDEDRAWLSMTPKGKEI